MNLSKQEEVISVLWTIAALLAFGFGYTIYGRCFAVLAVFGHVASIYHGIKEVRARREEV